MNSSPLMSQSVGVIRRRNAKRAITLLELIRRAQDLGQQGLIVLAADAADVTKNILPGRRRTDRTRCSLGLIPGHPYLCK